ncbi:MAG: hypothetical protein DKM24_04985 [Candidatus Melainabacteria bacterium]|nr:MAG: hypothetical protein DKM24_04985 [Candidatus Melainabacteria bacterium]
MISGVNANVAFQGGVAPKAQQFQQAVNTQVAPDTAEFSGKKKSNAVKKGIIGTVVGLAVAAAALYAGVKSGKLTEVANATKWTEKLQNLAFKGGKGVEAGVKYVTTKGKDVIDWCKEKMPSKEKVKEVAVEAWDTYAGKAKEVAENVTETIVDALPDTKFDLKY